MLKTRKMVAKVSLKEEVVEVARKMAAKTETKVALIATATSNTWRTCYTGKTSSLKSPVRPTLVTMT